MSPTPFSAAAAGLKVAVRLTPKASRDRILGAAAEADGSLVLKAQVTAVPEDGKANAALLKLLSKAWRIPRSDMEIVLGHTDRRKVVLITGDSQALANRLEQWMADNHE